MNNYKDISCLMMVTDTQLLSRVDLFLLVSKIYQEANYEDELLNVRDY